MVRDVEGAFFSDVRESVTPLEYDVVVPRNPKANATHMLSKLHYLAISLSGDANTTRFGRV